MELKKATKEDFIFFLKIKSEPENMYWTGHDSKPNIEHLREWFYKELESKHRNILIAFNAGVPIGYAYTYFIDKNRGLETAVAVSSEFSGVGYGTEIVKQTVTFCFKYYPDTYIQAWIWNENMASIKIHEKIGYKNTGISREYSGNVMHLYKMIR